jgi:3-methylcrotonyl-CoA carboxylase alpha subunit
MPGRVIKVFVEAGAAVAKGASLMVVEAMKMEHTIVAPTDGRVVAIHYAAGDAVKEGADLIDIAPNE